MLSTKEFQNILLINGGDILDNIDPKEVEQYHYIRQNLHKTDVSNDEEFQGQFSTLNKLKGKRLDAKLMEIFFQHLEKGKHNPEADIREISKQLFGIRPINFETKHFSMLTRFLNTIHENYPVYNKEVADLLESELPTDKKIPYFRKANKYYEIYANTISLYEQVLENGKIYNLIRALELSYKPFKESLSHSKNLDLLVRSAGNLKKQGKLMNSGNSVFQGTKT